MMSRCRALAVFVVASIASVTGAQPRIVLLGSGTAMAVKSDGTAVAGSFSAGSVLNIGSSVTATSIPGFTPAVGTPDLMHFAGTTSSGLVRWDSATGTARPIVRAASLGGSMFVRAISADGRYVAGWGYESGSGGAFKPWVWDAAAAGGSGLMVALPTSAGNGQARVVGNNGVVAGVDGCCGSANRPAIWTFESGSAAWLESFLPFDGGAAPLTGGDIEAMNDAGTVIVGSIALTSGFIEMARWTLDPGTQAWSRVTVPLTAMVRPTWLGVGYDTRQFIATGVSGDGSQIVGITVYTLFSSFARGGFVWRSATGQAVDFWDWLDGQGTPGIAALGGNPPSLGFPIVMTSDGQHMATLAGPQTGLGPPTLVSMNGGPCVAPSAEAVNSTTTATAGSSAFLNCVVTGSQPLTIQWRFNGNPIADGPSGSGSIYHGATGQGTVGVQLLVTQTTPADTGVYDCVVTNACGTATRPETTLTISSGACCSAPGGILCTIEGAGRCTSSAAVGGLGGVYLGNDTTCGTGACDAVSGACCFWAGSAICLIDVSPHCTLVGSGGYAGVYLGNGSVCGPAACDAAMGACCYSPDGQSSVGCSVELSSRCTRSSAQGGLGGIYVGNGAACEGAGGGVGCPAGVAGIGACCFNPTLTGDITCTVHVSSRCTATQTNGGLQGKYQGDGVACSAGACRPGVFGSGSSLGACCFTDPANPASGALCIIAYLPNCTNYPNGSNDANTAPFNIGLGGNFFTNTCCGPSSIEPIAGCSTTADCAAGKGACIHAPFDATTDAVCTLQVRASRCTRQYNAGGLFGTFVAGASACSPALLAANAGACCYVPSGQACQVCTLQPQPKCTQVNNGGLSGTFGGLGSVCSPVPACGLALGACCTSSSCSIACAIECVAGFGAYMGDGSGCAPTSPCESPSGVCCRGATCLASVASAAACTALLGTNAIAGASFVASAACNAAGNTTAPCCHADYNKVNGLSVQDIFDFLNDWFAGSPFAIVGSDGSGGTLGVQNIFDFLNTWFAGGC
ncbi:MAG TPA: immunoglobulin domain-containing protein [Phycisphaerales bacterium]|nr:immunoglobulin domain-containing protein [Phycisphaerales bacterium]